MMSGATLPEEVLITGGTGFIGGHLVSRLLELGVGATVLSRQVQPPREGVTFIQSLNDWTVPEGRYAVVNLAGEPLNKGRWNAERKARYRSSRIELTQELVRWIARQDNPPESLVSGSAVGWYGHRGDDALTELSNAAPGYSHDLCADWEEASAQGLPDTVRRCVLRTGVVLGSDGGPLPEMLTPARLGLGGPLGTGEQWWSWIHVADLVGIIVWLLQNPACNGVFNGTAPHPVRQGEFAKTLGEVLHRPAFMPLPAFVARAMLGEFAEEILLNAQRVEPARVQALGFAFEFPSLKPALDDILG